VLIKEHQVAERNLVVHITVGAIPQRVLDSMSRIGGVLEHMLTRGEEIRITETPSTLTDPGETYTTLLVSERVEVAIAPDRIEQDYFWYDIGSVETRLLQFYKESRRVMDAAVGQLTGLLGPELMHTMLHESRVLIEAEGKPSQPIPEFHAGEARASLTRTPEDLRCERLDQLDRILIRDFEGIGRWVSAASGEPDPVKRFFWAYAGLEVLTGLAVSLATSILTIRLASLDESLTEDLIRQLFYPLPEDDAKDPWRSAAFGFAAMAAAMGGREADADVRKFKRIQKFRNRIHGGRVDERVAEREAFDAMELLRRYSVQVSQALAAKRQV
jgi:hypothetical protein